MTKKVYKIALLILVLTFILWGCGFWPSDSSKDYVEIASTAIDYREKEREIVALMGIIDREFFEGSNLLAPLTLFTREKTIVWNDGTIITIFEILDDKDTPSDRQDDILTITKSYEVWEGSTKVEKIIRPRKPEADWDCWVEDVDEIERCIQDDIPIELFIEGIKTHNGMITLTWIKKDGEILLEKFDKILFGVGQGGTAERIVIEINESGVQNTTVYSVRVTEGNNDVVVHSFSVEEIEKEGEIFTKITRDDGFYTLILKQINPKVKEFYNPGDVLYMKVTEILDKGTGKISIVREIYNQGNLVDVKFETVQFRLLGNEIIVTKTFDNGDEILIRIQEGVNSYIINRNGLIYHIVFISNGIEMYDENMDLIATVVFNEDGTWTVIYPNNTSVNISL